MLSLRALKQRLCWVHPKLPLSTINCPFQKLQSLLWAQKPPPSPEELRGVPPRISVPSANRKDTRATGCFSVLLHVKSPHPFSKGRAGPGLEGDCFGSKDFLTLSPWPHACRCLLRFPTRLRTGLLRVGLPGLPGGTCAETSGQAWAVPLSPPHCAGGRSGRRGVPSHPGTGRGSGAAQDRDKETSLAPHPGPRPRSRRRRSPGAGGGLRAGRARLPAAPGRRRPVPGRRAARRARASLGDPASEAWIWTEPLCWGQRCPLGAEGGSRLECRGG
ncbi:collagen alpha-4(IV) chain-like [Choloepus didactylus]|uniref:collagen alpha-4(IV) chain-like n=1 Tax=Choloepus didactylus TaxID=27675 RepID=UPI0018A0C175|nr:collagen alpha-4(IV) chain-like [Choloepus didactylus]